MQDAGKVIVLMEMMYRLSPFIINSVTCEWQNKNEMRTAFKNVKI